MASLAHSAALAAVGARPGAGRRATAGRASSAARSHRGDVRTTVRAVGGKTATQPSFMGLRKSTALPRFRSAAVAAPSAAPRAGTVASAASARAPYEGGAVDMNQILEERDACGVGFIASLKGERTHKTISDSLTALGCMEHRGACSADDDSGDGAGIMCDIPWKMLGAHCDAAGIAGFEEGKSGVGMVFLPQDKAQAAKAKETLEASIKAEGLTVLGWRAVPVNKDVVGRMARDTEPVIEQVLVGGAEGDELERKLYVARKTAEKAAAGLDAEMPGIAENFYVCTMSGRVIVYKGMLRSAVVGAFYLDLQDEDFEAQFCIYHRRFSTNTVPKWPLAQPMRFLGHNGEINTLQGNLNWMASKEADMTHPVWDGREAELRPICNPAASDSANLDRVAELLVKSGRPVAETMMLLVPEAYRNHPELDATYPEVEKFYDYFAGMQEAWDGPALLVFTDGKKLGCRLDRNGLRPARFWRTADDYIYVASEVGVLGDVISNAKNIVAKGRLGPGQMIQADLESGEFMENTEVAKAVAARCDYESWLKEVQFMPTAEPAAEPKLDPVELITAQAAAGYAAEDVSMIIESMAAAGGEPTWSMGDDTPMPVLSGRPHLLYDYFKQRFAQVTNPAIDPLREGLVMSLEMTLGAKGNLLNNDGAKDIPAVSIKSPVLFDEDVDAVMAVKGLNAKRVPAFYADDGSEGALRAGLDALCAAAEKAVGDGCQCVVLSDKPSAGAGAAIPSLLAVGAVHHHLIKVGLRTRASLVVESASAFSTHHVACLVGYGASAVNPWLALETCRSWRASKKVENAIERGKMPNMSTADVQRNYKAALNAGLKKILSKMGISLLTSYHGAQIFECYGIGPELIDAAFKGTVSRVGGLNMDELAAETAMFAASNAPESGEDAISNVAARGMFQVKPGLEYHANNQEMSKLLHKAVDLGGKGEGSADAYKLYEEHRNERPATSLRDMLVIDSDRESIDIAEVESVADICERFCTGGMSLGAISRECHEAIAIAVNRIGGRSNSGEGGEDPQRNVPIADADAEGNSATFPHLRGLQNGDVATSAIRQVASGRFGVTTAFLMGADQLEIKVAQGAKPGEGGQLPGKKVSPYIASLRRSKAGVPLISPPPHHDIYSIEDLSQLIYDLHMVNPDAKVSVKLVGQAGIGTVASGVAKANADIIQISGGDGGTGASPLSSIKHAGGPMEMGLVEAHRTLVENDLRDRVVLRADGGCRSGLDVIQCALMGADEYGFGTVAMIATGCVMARICHTNNCPVGVASQREELRARFPGAPGDLVNFFQFCAQEVRVELARMGYKSLDEVIGRNDLFKQAKTLADGSAAAGQPAKTSELDLSFLCTSSGASGSSKARRAMATHGDGRMLDDEILEDAEVQAAIEEEGSVTIARDVVNVDRAATARVSGAVAARYGDAGFAGAINIELTGSAGQSFGAFCVGGVNVRLEGEANDYVCKSMSGGEVAIMPPADSPFRPEDCIIAGNTCLYGATGGRVFINGRAGERFAVRNSLAETVVEGTGDHCCEYMTGGAVVVLGKVGRNVGAGMTGGLGYFLDEDESFPTKVNGEIVSMQRVSSQAGEAQLKALIEAHVAKTGSPKGAFVLVNWEEYLPKFWQLVPPSEANTPEASDEVVSAEAVKAA